MPVAQLTDVFNKYNPAYPYTYTFADESYAAKFNLELLIGKLAGLFAGLAIFISCLGLFGLAAYIAEQRTKEIGIRKVLGASVSQVWLLLSKEFIVLVLISSVIASPIALYFLSGWLQKYSYRISIGASVFFWAAFTAIVITLVTISFQAIKAALTNPVRSLRIRSSQTNELLKCVSNFFFPVKNLGEIIFKGELKFYIIRFVTAVEICTAAVFQFGDC